MTTFWRKARKAVGRLLEADVVLASIVERLLLLYPWTTQSPRLFILGLPRSGTTLVYQYIVHRLHVAYFTNAAGRYYLAPGLATWVQRGLHTEHRSNFRSEYGTATGPTAPHEAGRFWGRFFGFEEYISPHQVSDADRRLLRRTLSFVQQAFGDRPFVNKNVKHLLRIPALHDTFPDALFLRVRRDWSDVALSLLRSRHDNLEDPTTWWSARPPDHRALEGLPPSEQIAHQIQGLSAVMDEHLSALPSDQTLSVRYPSFCANPDLLVQRLQSRLPQTPTRNSAVQHFSPSTNIPQTAEEARLADHIATLMAS
jgi:hypothetical protein